MHGTLDFILPIHLDAGDDMFSNRRQPALPVAAGILAEIAAGQGEGAFMPIELAAHGKVNYIARPDAVTAPIKHIHYHRAIIAAGHHYAAYPIPALHLGGRMPV